MAFACVNLRIFLRREKQFQFCGYYGLFRAIMGWVQFIWWAHLDIKQSDSNWDLSNKYCQHKLYTVSNALDKALNKNIIVPCLFHLPICQSSMMRNWVMMPKGIKYHMAKWLPNLVYLMGHTYCPEWLPLSVYM